MTTSPAPSDVRAWAKGQGLDVGDRGRLPQRLVDAYVAAGAARAAAPARPARRTASPRPTGTLGTGGPVAPRTARPEPAPKPQAPPDGTDQVRAVQQALDETRQETARLREELATLAARVDALERPSRGRFGRR